jgi:hypothetical protein
VLAPTNVVTDNGGVDFNRSWRAMTYNVLARAPDDRPVK